MNLYKKNLKQAKKFNQLFLLLISLNLVMPFPLSVAAEVPENMKIDPNNADDTISMSFDGALLKDVLLLFSQQSGLNFIASSDVESKKVTVFFENVTPLDALDSIITANDLAYSKKPGSDIYMVYLASKTTASSLVTKVIRLKYMRLSSSPLDVGGEVTINSLRESSVPTSIAATSSSSSASTTASSDKGVDKLVSRLLTSQGRLAQDIQTNSLIITDTANNVAAIEKVLAEVDVPPSQVILEVHVMEIEKTLASNVGIEWGGTNGVLGSFSGGTRTAGFPFNQRFLNRKANLNLLAADTTATFNTVTQPSTVVMGTVDAANFAATLHYIESDIKTKVLARPRVLTQNNEAAEIKLVTHKTIGVISTSTTSGGVTNNTNDTPERADVGVTLRMTPQINEDNSVLLYVEPAVSTANVSAKFTTFQDVTTRSVRTMARIKDNQTLVIGGLINGNDLSTKQKMPFLGDLPAIGHLFSYDSASNNDLELVVFVTPHIVYGASSLGSHSATALGEDVSLRRMLDAFMEKEMDQSANDFHELEKNKQAFFTTDQQFIRDTEKRLSNPVVDKQMTQALDALSPQLIDAQMTQALDSLSGKKYLS